MDHSDNAEISDGVDNKELSVIPEDDIMKDFPTDEEDALVLGTSNRNDSVRCEVALGEYDANELNKIGAQLKQGMSSASKNGWNLNLEKVMTSDWCEERRAYDVLDVCV